MDPEIDNRMHLLAGTECLPWHPLLFLVPCQVLPEQSQFQSLHSLLVLWSWSTCLYHTLHLKVRDGSFYLRWLQSVSGEDNPDTKVIPHVGLWKEELSQKFIVSRRLWLNRNDWCIPGNNIFATKLQKYYFDLNSMTKFSSEEIVFFLWRLFEGSRID